jgi:2-polyprenyl-6-hydroxyphenyl methylase/3-demethylubiquinone-9 3-methyltransferase
MMISNFGLWGMVHSIAKVGMGWKWTLAQRLELWWWKRYLRNRVSADYLSWKRDYWNGFIHTLPASLLQQPTRVLDAGCGPAGIFTVLQQHEVTAFDPLLDKYKAHLSVFDESLYPTVHFSSSTLENGVAGEWPVVFCLNAINHVQHWEASLDRLYQMVSPGGCLVLSTDAHRSTLLRNIFRLIPGDMLHPQQHTCTDYRNALTARGFVIMSEEVLTPGKVFDYWRVIAKKSPTS